MAPYWKTRWRRPYRRYYKNYFKRRLRYRPRRSRKAFRRNRRTTWVRRHRYYKLFRKKLKKIRLNQYQPVKIRKCKIKGYLQLFEAGKGRFGNSFTLYKESFTPPHEPGGGGWSMQQLSLGILYAQNNLILNWWTQSNKGLPLVRYSGVKITLFRQERTDYIFWYDIEGPIPLTKYTYASFHPIKLLLEKKKVVVPSITTHPHKRKPYKTKWITPPKEMIDKWYFQEHLSSFPLITFGAAAVSLQSLFQPTNAINNSITLYTLNTPFFQNPRFQYALSTTGGYDPKQNTYLYGLINGALEIRKIKRNAAIYLGNTMINDPGDPLGTTAVAQYGKNHWGNPFYHKYLDGSQRTFITNKNYKDFYGTSPSTTEIGDVTQKFEPFIYTLRYNPDKDTGKGNQIYWVSNVHATNYEPPTDPDLKMEGYPLWLMLWGWEDYTRKLGKLRNLDQDYMLAIRTSFFSEKLPTFILLSETFTQGEGPYNVDFNELSLQDREHWYPRWRYQKEAINAIIQTGPGVCKSEYQQSVQAHIKYDFRFKWGGNPPTMENINDPNSQPTYPTPGNLQLLNEITSPAESLTTYLYNWDFRRDILTQTAAERITKSTENDYTLFTDGINPSTEIPTKTTPQEKTAQEEEEKKILQQLSRIYELNSQLRNRLNLLKLQIENT
nr:MAG: ORF1 [TTV-like mini virus]